MNEFIRHDLTSRIQIIQAVLLLVRKDFLFFFVLFLINPHTHKHTHEHTHKKPKRHNRPNLKEKQRSSHNCVTGVTVLVEKRRSEDKKNGGWLIITTQFLSHG
jgi:hypothetical protein